MMWGMKLFSVISIVYDLANSVTPPQPITPATQAAAVIPLPLESMQMLMAFGYTSYQSVHLYEGVFNHYWYDLGVHEVFHCRELTHWHLRDMIPRLHGGVHIEPFLPPIVYFSVAVVGIMVIIVLLAAPDWTKDYNWVPPDTLYIGTYNEEIWLMTLVGVSSIGTPVYHVIAHYGAKILVHYRRVPFPPGEIDRFWFGGSLRYECWQAPWFRVFWARYADVNYLGTLEQTGVWTYKLRKGGHDPFAPSGPWMRPIAEWNKVVSPCGEYTTPAWL